MKYKCIVCNCEYDRKPEHKKAKDIKEYVKHLGCCKEKCFNKLDEDEKDGLFIDAYLSNMVGLST